MKEANERKGESVADIKPTISLWEAMAVLGALVLDLGICIVIGRTPPHIPILLFLAFLVFWGRIRGFSWDTIHGGISKGVSPGIIPLMIFILIGVLVSSWIAAGTIQTIAFYAYALMSETWFLSFTFIVCMAIGLAVGSSFTTISTVGIVFMTVGGMMGIPMGWVAGAVVSGAFLANNLSPLSDTANLAAGIGRIDVLRHILYAARTSAVAAAIALIGYFLLDQHGHAAGGQELGYLMETMDRYYSISPWALLPVAVILFASWRHIPALPTLMGSIITALLVYVGEGTGMWQEIPSIVMSGYVSHTGVDGLDVFLSRGGMMSMMGSVALIILALAMGGLLVELSVIPVCIQHMAEYVRTPQRLVAGTAMTSVLVNLFAGEQYLSMILPGETFGRLYDTLHLKRVLLTRTLVDAGVAVNALIPWGVSGTFIAGTLGISPLEYIPYAFYPIAIPLCTLMLGMFFPPRRTTSPQ